MLDNERGPTPLDAPSLGENFTAQSSPSYGGELGRSFEEHNSSREEWEKEKHRGRRMMIWGGSLVLLLIIVVIVYLATRPKAGNGEAGGSAHHGRGQTGPAAITVDESTTGNMNIYVDALGTVTPLHTITLYSQITGRVESVHYREGQIVRKGQPLVDIDPRPYQAALVQAQGTLNHDQGILAEAQMDLKRYQDAFAKNAIARQQLEDQEKAVVQDEGTIVQDQGAIQTAQTNLSYTHIVSPINGRVGLRLVDPGNTVFSGTGSTLVVITQLQPITVVFTVSEDNLPEIQTQLRQGHMLTVDAYDRSNDNKIATGKLTSLDNQIDTTTGTLKFRATFENNDLSLFPNQFVNARLLVQTLENATLVPTAAVQHNGTQAFVYVVTPGAPHKKPASGAPSSGTSNSGNANAEPEPAKGGSGSSKGQGGTPVTVHVQNIQTLTSDEYHAAVTGVGPNTKLATSGFDRLEDGAEALVQPNQNTGQGHGKHAAGQQSPNSQSQQNSSPAGSTQAQ
jgi:multidrug efflux system membrane fusion protein